METRTCKRKYVPDYLAAFKIKLLQDLCCLVNFSAQVFLAVKHLMLRNEINTTMPIYVPLQSHQHYS